MDVNKVALIATKALKEIKVTLGMEVKLEQYKSGDATLEAEMLEPGQAIFVVSEDGNVPAPAGEHTLDDGRVVVVVEDGLIDSVRDAEMPAEEEQEMEEAEKPTEEKEPKKIVESTEVHFSKDDAMQLFAEMEERIFEKLKQEFKNEGEVVEEIPASDEVIEAAQEEETQLKKHSPKVEKKRLDFRSNGKSKKERFYTFLNKQKK